MGWFVLPIRPVLDTLAVKTWVVQFCLPSSPHPITPPKPY